jgi:hypothetical protein
MKVSVMMITYNHEEYISQAIESVLMQETDFPYELVIGEDCSTDGTRQVVVDYQEKNPEKIRLLLSAQNLGMHENARRTRQACRGEYIAVLEGDDYWTDPHKLQKQVDFLDSHPECAMCFHAVKWVFEEGSREPRVVYPPERKDMYRLEDLLERNFISTGTTMARSGLQLNNTPSWACELAMGDWPFFLQCARQGYIGYVDEIMAVYRVHGGGVWSRTDPVQRYLALLEFYERVDEYLDFRYEKTVQSALQRQWEAMVEGIAKTGSQQAHVNDGLNSVMQMFEEWPKRLALSDVQRSKILGKLYSNFMFNGYHAGDMQRVRYCLPRSIRYDASLLRNPGVWSIGLEAFLGYHIASWLRVLAQEVVSMQERHLIRRTEQ